jgi:hypothetical protein
MFDNTDCSAEQEAQAEIIGKRAAIRAQIFGCDTVAACGITITAYAPVLELSRRLVAAGYDPAALPCAFASARLVAKFTVQDDNRGTPRLRRYQEPALRVAAASLVRQKRKPAISTSAEAAA